MDSPLPTRSALGPTHDPSGCSRSWRLRSCRSCSSRHIASCRAGLRRGAAAPTHSAVSGNPDGLERNAGMRRPAARATVADPAASAIRSGGSWWRIASTPRIDPARATSTRQSPRWKRPASECGHGSIVRTISRPSSESVHRFARAAVAGRGLGPVANEPPFVIGLVAAQVLALRTFPRVLVGVVGEAGRPVPLRACVGVARKEFHADRDGEQEDRVGVRHQGLGVNLVHVCSAGARTGSVTSAKRISSGSSSVTRGTV
jgi:hypothetical protein